MCILQLLVLSLFLVCHFFAQRFYLNFFVSSATTGPRWGAKALFQGHRPLASTGQVTLEAFCDSRGGPGEVSPSI